MLDMLVPLRELATNRGGGLNETARHIRADLWQVREAEEGATQRLASVGPAAPPLWAHPPVADRPALYAPPIPFMLSDDAMMREKLSAFDGPFGHEGLHLVTLPEVHPVKHDEPPGRRFLGQIKDKDGRYVGIVQVGLFQDGNGRVSTEISPMVSSQMIPPHFDYWDCANGLIGKFLPHWTDSGVKNAVIRVDPAGEFGVQCARHGFDWAEAEWRQTRNSHSITEYADILYDMGELSPEHRALLSEEFALPMDGWPLPGHWFESEMGRKQLWATPLDLEIPRRWIGG
jgi:hypothetical protein